MMATMPHPTAILLALALSACTPEPDPPGDSAPPDDTTAPTDTAPDPMITLPRVITTYYIGGFDELQAQAVLDAPDNTGALMLAGFDYMRSISDNGDGTWAIELNQDRIDAIHAAGLYAWVDVAAGWAPTEFWSDWDALAAFLLQLAEAGIDGVDLDEFQSAVDAPSINALRADLRAVNPELQLVVTQVYASQLESLLEAGARPDAIALAWYIAGPAGFERCKSLAEEHDLRCVYWADPSTYGHIQQIADESSAVMLWNLCWHSSTCPGDDYWTWVPWDQVQPELAGLDPFGSFPVVE
jgi:hypothetical protein